MSKPNKKFYYLIDIALMIHIDLVIIEREISSFIQLNENDIMTGCKNVPTIWYIDNSGKKHRHYVDIFIPSMNKCIEIKSTWTFTKQKDIVLLKQNAAKELGYTYEIWVYDSKGNKLENHI
jgi:hypothetical protein